jgi:hypothetical protein
MLIQQIVPNHAQPKLVGIRGIRKKGNEDVYCLATKVNGNFIANGVIVKNCDALRYAIYTHFFGKEMSRMSAQDLDRLYLEAMGGNNLPAPFRDVPGGFGY